MRQASGITAPGGTKLGVGGDFVTAPELSDSVQPLRGATGRGDFAAHRRFDIWSSARAAARMAAVILETLAERDCVARALLHS